MLILPRMLFGIEEDKGKRLSIKKYNLYVKVSVVFNNGL